MIPRRLGIIASQPAVGRAFIDAATRSIFNAGMKRILAALLLLTLAAPAMAQDGPTRAEQSYAVPVKAWRWAAEHGDAFAQLNLGIMYDMGQGVAQNYAEAVKWFRKAAGQGDAGGQTWLGAMYYEGHGVPQDYTEAMKWYRRASEQGNANGQLWLGSMYGKGQGVAQDYAEAMNWYRKAAEQGDASAQFNLGVMYNEGQGVPPDYVQAYMWYNLSAAQEPVFMLAALSRDLVAKRMTAAQIAEAQKLARDWLAGFEKRKKN